MLPRTRAVLAAAVAILVAGASVDAVVALPRRAERASVVRALPALSAQVIEEINSARSQHGLARLRASHALGAAASFHSYDMARHGFFSHESVNGNSVSARLARYYHSAGYARWQIGETLLWYSPGVNAAAIVRDWLASSDHRPILLDAAYREVGVSAVHTPRASGWFRGDAVTIVTADFGVRTR